ncbi:MAG: hypothetical protein RL328_2171 [Acidobacteriota bacterium]|jgi:hypothetical protein
MPPKKNTVTALQADSWEELKRCVHQCAEDLGKGPDEELWFRGAPSKLFRLAPSLQRLFPDSPFDNEDVLNLENNLFFEFLSRARVDGTQAKDQWDVLFLMQHYRAPTRLLDWTTILHVAVYFALFSPCSNGCVPPCNHSVTRRIWVMNPYLWNEETQGERDLYWPRFIGWDEESEDYYDYDEILIDSGQMYWQSPIALYNPQTETRMAAQRGYFTIHGTDVRPLDQQHPHLLRAIDLTPKAVQEAKEELEFSGTDDYRLFPDFEGLARTLRNRPLPAIAAKNLPRKRQMLQRKSR